jgi:hypothetical protein
MCTDPRVSMIPRVSHDTVLIRVRYVPVPGTGAVSAGTGAVSDLPTRGIPVPNPKLFTLLYLLVFVFWAHGYQKRLWIMCLICLFSVFLATNPGNHHYQVCYSAFSNYSDAGRVDYLLPKYQASKFDHIDHSLQHAV